MAANFAANQAEKYMGPQPEGTAATGNIANYGNKDVKDRAADPSGEKMKALVWKGANKVAVIETNKPDIVDDGDAVVRVTGSTICGSDLHLYHGAIIEMQDGDILGHEYMGIVEKVGPKVKKVKPGDRVVASFQISCGTCRFCTQKLSSMCQRTNSSSVANAMYGSRTAGILGYSHLTGGYAGGQAEYVRQAFADVNLLKVPRELPDEKVLYLSDVLPTSYHCVVDTGVYKGDTVGVWGVGPIGLMVCKFAFLKGAKRVIAVDSVGWRLEYAKKHMPDLEVINYSTAKGNVVDEIKKKCPQGLDAALECAAGEYAKGWLHKIETAIGAETDTSEILNEMIASVRPFGRIGVTGVYAGFTNHFNIGAVMQTGIRFIGNGQAPVLKYWEELLNDYILPGKVDPLMMVSHRVDLSEMDELYRRFDARKETDGIMKVFVQTKHSSPPGKGAPALTTFKS